MTVAFKRLVPAAIALLTSATVCLAAAPSGLINFSFSANDAPVYDLGGSFQFDQTIIGAGQTEFGLSYGINLAEDNRGFLTGSGVTAVAVGDNFVAADYTARGKVSARGGSTRVTLTVRMKGEDVIAGVTTPFTITIAYVLFINSETATMEGTARGSARFGRLGGGRMRSNVSVALPPGADGAWTLQLNVAAFGPLAGSGFIVLSNGRTLAVNLAGRYSPTLDRSTIRASGFGDSRGNSATIVFDSEGLLLLRGTVLGQTVRE